MATLDLRLSGTVMEDDWIWEPLIELVPGTKLGKDDEVCEDGMQTSVLMKLDPKVGDICECRLNRCQNTPATLDGR